MITDEQAKVNQEAIDLIYEYCDLDGHFIDPKGLLKYLFCQGYRIVKDV